MIRRITANLTLVAMLWHAALGCSWHHAHAAEGNWSCGGVAGCCGESHQATHESTTHSHAPPAVEKHDADHGPTHLSLADESRLPQPHVPARCLEGDCSYLRHSDADGPSLDRDLSSPRMDKMDLADRDEVSPRRIALSLAALLAAPYLPRCETKQVWLI